MVESSDQGGSSRKPLLRPLPCAHRGAPTEERVPCPPPSACQQIVHNCRLHVRCTIGPSESVYHACCNCPDYYVGTQSYTQPSALLARPGKHVLVTINVGGVLSDHVRRSHECAAGRWRCDYEALETRRLPSVADPRWEKVTLQRWAQERGYARVVYVDADVLVRSDAPSLFSVVPQTQLGVVANDQLPGPHWRPGKANVASKSLEIWSNRLNLPVPSWEHVPNSGVIVFDTANALPLFERWYKAGEECGWRRLGGWTDQSAFALLVQLSYLGSEICWLPAQWNLLVHRPDMVPTDGTAPAFLTHFAGSAAKPRIANCQWDLRPAPYPGRCSAVGQGGSGDMEAPLGPAVIPAVELGKRVVITLGRRPERLAAFESQWPEDWSQDDVTTFYGVDGSNVIPPAWWQHGAGQWGARQSHLRVLEMAIGAGWDRVTVFEDDAELCPGYNEALKRFLEHIPSDWELLYLGGQTLRHTAHQINDYVVRPGYCILAHAYVLRKRGLWLAYQYGHEHYPSRGEFDHALARLSASGEVKAYAPAQWLVWQRPGFSDIRQCERPRRGIVPALGKVPAMLEGGEHA